MSSDLPLFFDHTFALLSRTLRENRAPRAQWLALDRALVVGLSPHARSSAGESLLELCARLGAQEACLALLELGSDPFAAPHCTDARGQFTLLRGFEAFLVADLPEAARRALHDLSFVDRSRFGAQWVELSRLTHPLARRCRSGGGWTHLCAAASAPDCLEIVLRFNSGVHDHDDFGGEPLLACSGGLPATVRCVNLLALAGADPEHVDRVGLSVKSILPLSWRQSATHSEGSLIAMATRTPPSCPKRRRAL